MEPFLEFRSFRRISHRLFLKKKKLGILIEIWGVCLSEKRNKLLTNLGPRVWKASVSSGV